MFPADLVTFTEDIPNGKLHFFVQWKWNSTIIPNNKPMTETSLNEKRIT